MGKASFTFFASRLQALGRLTLMVLGVLSFAYTANAQDCNVGCNDNINVTLDDGCSAVVTADMLLEGYECLGMPSAAFKIIIVGDDASNDQPAGGETTIDDCGKFIYEISVDPSWDGDVHPALAGWPGCWGYITGEDKTDPAFVNCYSTGVVGVPREAQLTTGYTDEGYLNFGNYSCFQDVYNTPPNCTVGYDLISFEVDNDDQPEDIYTFEVYDYYDFQDLQIALYVGEFDPNEPCSNIIAHSNIVNAGVVSNEPIVNGGPDLEGRFRISATLVEDQEYTLLVASADCSAQPYFRAHVYSDGGGEVIESEFGAPFDAYVYHTLMCSDVDEVLDVDPRDADYIITYPIPTDNCTDYEGLTESQLKDLVTFQDELVEEGDCGQIYIRRTWSIEDEKGRTGEVCVQYIYFYRPSLHHVQRPPTTVPIECDEDVPLDDNGHPSPEVAGYPFVISAFGIHDLNDSYCNVGASYDDISVINVCESTVKIVRQWTIIDWCYVPGQDDLNNSPLVNYRQIIKWGDFTAPVVEEDPEDELIGTGPFSCEGTIRIQSLDVTDNCSAFTVTATVYQIEEVPVYDKYGNEIDTEDEVTIFREGLSEGDLVDGAELGNTYKVHYDIVDDCDNATTASYYVTIEDNIEPVAVCDDDLHISIGGEGIGRVTAEDVDEGSWDNCELEDVWVSRKLVDAATRDAYLDEVYGLTFGDLVKAQRNGSRLYDMDKSSDADIYVIDEDGDGKWDYEEDEGHRVLRYKDGMWYTWWRSEIWFLCIDMGLDVTIELLARDVYGNTNLCWLDVLIEDKVAPYCDAPDDVEMYCDELPYGFDPNDDDQLSAMFGDAVGTDNCNATAEQIDKTVIWECNSGTITRYFEATDDKGLTSRNTCKQVIDVHRVHNYEIKFPKDASADCGAPSPDTIETAELACDLLSVNVYDERFEASGDACYKIKRTYKVINWCEYDGESPAVVIRRDEDCDGVTGEHDVYVLRRPSKVFTDYDNDEDNKNPKKSPCNSALKGHLNNSENASRLESTGYWQYSQFIKVYDTTPPTITANLDNQICSIAADCAADVSIPVTIEDVCAEDDLTVKVFLLPDVETTDLPEKVDLQVADNAGLVDFVLSGTYPNFTLSGRFPLGDHAFEVHAVDGCRNSELEIIPFSVIDCKAPTPICINGLAIELMPAEGGGGMMDIWASDFQVSGLTDCSDIKTVTIHRLDEIPNQTQTSLTLTCDDPETLDVKIVAWDNAYNPTAVQPDGSIGGPNWDFCLTYVLVQDNMFDLCDPAGPAAVSGLITDESNQTVENVEVNLTGGASNSLSTSVDGSYAFNGLEAGADYTITPVLDEDYLNGVSTFDLVLITKHILGTKKLDSPYKLIAADANSSGAVSALDLIQLRKLVLSVNRELAANTSWRFIPASYSFPDPTNPWAEAFPEILNYNDLQTAIVTGDFIAVKIGDVNGNATPNSTVAEQRTLTGVLSLNVADQKLIAGNEYRVNFTAPVADVQGYQFTLNYEGLELVDIEYGVAQAENFGVVEDGVLTTSWNGTASTDNLFTLVVRANVDAQLSDLMNVSSRYTQAEAYNTADELMGVALTFDGQAVAEAGFELYQNQPNPFQGQTMIGFTLPEAAQATVKIQDVTGKTLKLVRGDYAKGYNQINLNSSDLPMAGVLYYTLETKDFTATKKMVVIGE